MRLQVAALKPRSVGKHRRGKPRRYVDAMVDVAGGGAPTGARQSVFLGARPTAASKIAAFVAARERCAVEQIEQSSIELAQLRVECAELERECREGWAKSEEMCELAQANAAQLAGAEVHVQKLAVQLENQKATTEEWRAAAGGLESYANLLQSKLDQTTTRAGSVVEAATRTVAEHSAEVQAHLDEVETRFRKSEDGRVAAVEQVEALENRIANVGMLVEIAREGLRCAKGARLEDTLQAVANAGRYWRDQGDERFGRISQLVAAFHRGMRIMGSRVACLEGKLTVTEEEQVRLQNELELARGAGGDALRCLAVENFDEPSLSLQLQAAEEHLIGGFMIAAGIDGVPATCRLSHRVACLEGKLTVTEEELSAIGDRFKLATDAGVDALEGLAVENFDEPTVSLQLKTVEEHLLGGFGGASRALTGPIPAGAWLSSRVAELEQRLERHVAELEPPARTDVQHDRPETLDDLPARLSLPPLECGAFCWDDHRHEKPCLLSPGHAGFHEWKEPNGPGYCAWNPENTEPPCPVLPALAAQRRAIADLMSCTTCMHSGLPGHVEPCASCDPGENSRGSNWREAAANPESSPLVAEMPGETCADCKGERQCGGCNLPKPEPSPLPPYDDPRTDPRFGPVEPSPVGAKRQGDALRRRLAGGSYEREPSPVEQLPASCQGCGKQREPWEGTNLTADKRHLCGPCFVTDPQGLLAIASEPSPAHIAGGQAAQEVEITEEDMRAPRIRSRVVSEWHNAAAAYTRETLAGAEAEPSPNVEVASDEGYSTEELARMRENQAVAFAALGKPEPSPCGKPVGLDNGKPCELPSGHAGHHATRELFECVFPPEKKPEPSPGFAAAIGKLAGKVDLEPMSETLEPSPVELRLVAPHGCLSCGTAISPSYTHCWECWKATAVGVGQTAISSPVQPRDEPAQPFSTIHTSSDRELTRDEQLANWVEAVDSAERDIRKMADQQFAELTDRERAIVRSLRARRSGSSEQTDQPNFTGNQQTDETNVRPKTCTFEQGEALADRSGIGRHFSTRKARKSSRVTTLGNGCAEGRTSHGKSEIASSNHVTEQLSETACQNIANRLQSQSPERATSGFVDLVLDTVSGLFGLDRTQDLALRVLVKRPRGR